MNKHSQYSIFNIQYFARRGFTIVELLISVGIFTLLSGVVLARYRTFDTNAKFANASEDVVLALRQAQVYGVGVRGSGLLFDVPYGVHFVNGNSIVLFADTYPATPDGKYTLNSDTPVETIQWQNNITISKLICGSGNGACTSFLDITFKRPNVDAIIADNTTDVTVSPYDSGSVTLSNGTKSASVTITKAGQISLQ